MVSFQISDPPSKAVLNETAGAKGIYGALITFSVENLTALNRTATVNVIPAAEEERAWYKLTGASATNPTVSTVDFGPREVRTIEVAVTVPAGTTPKTSSLSLRVALESKPEDDAVDSRPVALTVPALPPIPPVPKQPFPWWAVAIAVCLVLLVGGGLTYALWPKPVPEEGMLVNVQTGSCLAIIGGGGGGGVGVIELPVGQWHCDKDPSRTWILIGAPGSARMIKSADSILCLTIAQGAPATNNIPVVASSCDDAIPSRRWNLISTPSGNYKIENAQTHKCLTIAGGRSNNDAIPAVQYNCDDDPSRTWTLKSPH